MDNLVRHHRVSIAGIDTFFREAGRADAPVVLLPHGYALVGGFLARFHSA